MQDNPADPTATLDVSAEPNGTRLGFGGRMDAAGTAPIWRGTVAASRQAKGRELVFDLAQVAAFDMTGAALLAAAETAHGSAAQVNGADERIMSLLGHARGARKPSAARRGAVTAPHERWFSWHWGDLLLGFRAAGAGVAFLGEVAVAIATVPWHRRMFRGSQFLRDADQAGVRALPLVLGLGFLMGLILAFESAIPMRQFGAVLYVANLVSLSLFRELGPLLAAIILAGRTGSAFAAEIGTMKVNQEIDALVAMGLDPLTMLVLPRLAAAVLVMPFLTVALDIAGLVGMAVVMKSFGFGIAVVEAQIQYWTTPGDLFAGLIKGVVFGAVIAAIGCRSGLSTGLGPRSVGFSATAAVVGGLVATIVLDGVFSVFFSHIGF